MKFCSKCGNEIFEDAVICPKCGCAVVGAKPVISSENDEVSIGLCILAALIPLFGFIYWPVKRKETPKRAKAVGVTAIVAWAVTFIFLMSSM